MTMRLARSAKPSVWTAAPREVIWDVVADATRGGQWSGESLGCEWLDGASEARPGVRFKGRNQRGRMRWGRVNEVVVADRPRDLVWRTLPTVSYPDSTQWRISLEEEAGDTRATEEMRILHLPRPMEIGLYWLLPAHRDRSPDLAHDLQRLKLVAEAESNSMTMLRHSDASDSSPA